MIKTASILLALLTGWVVFCGVLCESTGGPDPAYEFIVYIKVIPEKAEYKVGDSIWLDIKIPHNKLQDTWSGDSILLENAGIPLDFSIAEHVKKLSFDSTIATFFIEKPADSHLFESVFENTLGLQTSYGCGQDSIHFRMSICLKKPGVFSLIPRRFDTTFDFGSAYNCQSATGTSSIAFLEYIFEVGDAHQTIYDKVKVSPPPHYFSNEASMEALIFGKRVYWFEVVE